MRGMSRRTEHYIAEKRHTMLVDWSSEITTTEKITGSVLLTIFPMSHNFCITPNETPVSLESWRRSAPRCNKWSPEPTPWYYHYNNRKVYQKNPRELLSPRGDNNLKIIFLMKKPKTSVVSFTAYNTETKKITTNFQTWASQLTSDKTMWMQRYCFFSNPQKKINIPSKYFGLSKIVRIFAPSLEISEPTLRSEHCGGFMPSVVLCSHRAKRQSRAPVNHIRK